jgi:hypothetical protein
LAKDVNNMNIPILKCARGYHKRGGEFKVLYSGTVIVSPAAGILTTA